MRPFRTLQSIFSFVGAKKIKFIISGATFSVLFFCIFFIPVGKTSVLADQISVPANPVAQPAVSTPIAAPKPIVQTQPQLSSPTKLSIPKIKVSASIKAMGLTADDKMAVPNNFIDVGWYDTSAGGILPGHLGNAVIGAHVDNGGVDPTKAGVFKNLHTLVPGDDIYITDTNGTRLHFKVTSTKVYAYNSTDTAGVFGASGVSRLNLITCYGTWLPSAHTYNKRFIVFATLV